MHHQYLDQDTISQIASTSLAVNFHRAVALAVAYALPLPSMPVESPMGYFDEHFKTVSENICGVFTEVRPVPMADTVQNIKALWNARYAIAHGAVVPQITAGSGLNASVLSLFGISYNVPAPLLADLSDNAAAIEPLFARLLSAIVRTNMVAGTQTTTY